jgi:hypothetical protein
VGSNTGDAVLLVRFPYNTVGQVAVMSFNHVRIPVKANISTKLDEKAQNDVYFFQRLESTL